MKQPPTARTTDANHASLAARIAAHVARDPDATAFTFLSHDTHEVTSSVLRYGELHARARAIAAALRARKRTGQPVLLSCEPGAGYVCGLLGAWYAGAIAVPAYPAHLGSSRAAARIAAIARDADATLAIVESERDAEQGAMALGLETLALDSREVRDTACADAQLTDFDPEAPCLLQYTSGSTATPKGVLVSRAALLANQAMIESAAQVTRDDVILTWLPPYHDMGLMCGIVQPLYTGAPAALMTAEAFVRRPIRWLRAITKLRATLSAAPSFAFELCARRIPEEQRAELDLSSLRLVCNGAEPIQAGSIDAFCAAFEPHGFRRSAMFPCYGLAEATLVVSAGRTGVEPVVREFSAGALSEGRAQPSTADDTGVQRRIVGCGHAAPGSELRIVEPEACTPLPERSVGEIWVKSPSLAHGYFRKDADTEATFRARLATEPDAGPYLRTGDLGFLDRGELFVTGRRKDLIILHGVNHYPQDIERTVQSVAPALVADSGAAFAVERGGREQLVVVQELDHREKEDSAALLAQVAEAIQREHGIAVDAIVLIKKGSLFKTSSGKIQRSAMRKAYEAGELQIAARWPASKISSRPPPALSRPETQTISLSEARIARHLREQLAAKTGIAIAEIDDHAPLARYGVDSLLAAELTDELERWLGRRLPSTISFDHPTIAALARALSTPKPELATRAADSARDASRDGSGTGTMVGQPVTTRAADDDSAIAIVGMGCRFPGAPNLRGFWHMLRHGVDAVTLVPDARWDREALYDPDPSVPGKMSSRWGGFIEDIDQFDPEFFGISAREAARMDPQQRLFLEVTWEALEDAAIAPGALADSETGVFAGAATSDYALLFAGALDLVDADYGPGNSPSVIANRVSYFLNLKGPSLTFDTACSSSLVALQAACRSLALGETSLCIVGGVNAVLAPEPGVFFSKARAFAKDGKCKAFDESADGFVRSEGCGVVILKKLAQARAEGDRVYAIVAGSAVNHDGTSNGLLAPHGPSQERLIRRALADAGIEPNDLDYVEAHGVGAPLADAVETRALGAVLGTGTRAAPCLLGSVKANLGHLEAASGIAGVIKTALALTHQELPPQLHLYDVNPEIELERWSLAIPTVPTPWRRSARPRFGGVSAFGFGGTNAHVLLREAPLAAQKGQDHDARPERPCHLLALSARSPDALMQLAGRVAKNLGGVALADACFTANAGRARFAHRAAFVVSERDELAQALEQLAQGRAVTPCSGAPKIAFSFSGATSSGSRGEVRALCETQPEFRKALEHAAWVGEVDDERDSAMGLVIEHALYRLLRAWGVQPDVVCGRGAGEYAAAAAAGALEWDDALRLGVHYLEVVQSLSAGARIKRTVRAFKNELAEVTFRAPQLAFVSASQSRVLTEVPDAKHWHAHLYHAPRPNDALDALASTHADVHVPLAAIRDYQTLLGAVAELFVRGAAIDFVAFDAPFARSKIAMPTYPFARKRCWMEFPQKAGAADAPNAVSTAREQRVLSSHPFLARMSVRAPAHSEPAPSSGKKAG